MSKMLNIMLTSDNSQPTKNEPLYFRHYLDELTLHLTTSTIYTPTLVTTVASPSTRANKDNIEITDVEISTLHLAQRQ